MDEDGRGVLTPAQLTRALENEANLEMVETLGLPVGLSGDELFLLLDDRGRGEIPHAEVARNSMRLVASSTRPFEWHCIALLSMHRITALLRRLEQGGIHAESGDGGRTPRGKASVSASFPLPDDLPRVVPTCRRQRQARKKRGPQAAEEGVAPAPRSGRPDPAGPADLPEAEALAEDAGSPGGEGRAAARAGGAPTSAVAAEASAAVDAAAARLESCDLLRDLGFEVACIN